MQEEIWKDVIDFEDKYSISNLGRIWSKYRNKYITPSVNMGGYLFFMAKDRGRVKNLLVHRQVGMLFLPVPDKSLVEKCSTEHHGKVLINHIDGDKTNNTVNNLEWVDGKANMRHAFDSGLCVSPKSRTPKGVNSPYSTVKDINLVNKIKSEYIKFSREYGAAALAIKYNLPIGVVYYIIKHF